MASHSFQYLVIITTFLAHASYCRDIEREMTVEVKAGTEECFYELVKAGETLDVEYQVGPGLGHVTQHSSPLINLYFFFRCLT